MDQARIEQELRAAGDNLRKTAKAGATSGEVRYGMAYQAAVVAGVRPQLRKKYRGVR